MFPLKVVLVGCSENQLGHVRQEIKNYPAVLEADFRNLNEAIERWTWTDHDPRLLIYHFRGLDDVKELQCLRRAFRWPILALVQAPADQMATLFLLANRLGATQIVPLPLDTEDFCSALDVIGVQYGCQTGNAKVIAVSGVTGGCGATTVAINLASEIVHLQNLHTILVELAFQKGLLATYLNVEPVYTIPDLLHNNTTLDLHMVQRALAQVEENFDILSGSHHSISQVQVSIRDVLRLIDHLRRLSQVVVLDVPCSLDDTYLQTLSAATHVVLVAEQSLPSLRSLKLVLEMLGRANLKLDLSQDGSLRILLNRYNPNASEFDLNKLKDLLQVPQMMTVANDYQAVNSAQLRGVPVRHEAPKSRVVQDIDAMVHSLFGEPTKTNGTSPKGWGLFGKLVRAFAGRSA